MTKFFIFCFLALVLPSTVLADTAPTPKDGIILTVTGDITSANTEGAVELTLTELADLGSTTFETTTIWTEGLQTFEGVELAAILKELGVTSGTIKAIALNDYAIEIPVQDAVAGGPILAYKRNDKLMSVRDKGPLWVVFPYDSSPRFRTEVIYSQSIWQLAKMEITQ